MAQIQHEWKRGEHSGQHLEDALIDERFFGAAEEKEDLEATRMAKEKFKELYRKYGVLWKSLASSDSEVLQEYQSMLATVNEIKNDDGTKHIFEKENSKFCTRRAIHENKKMDSDETQHNNMIATIHGLGQTRAHLSVIDANRNIWNETTKSPAASPSPRKASHHDDDVIRSESSHYKFGNIDQSIHAFDKGDDDGCDNSDHCTGTTINTAGNEGSFQKGDDVIATPTASRFSESAAIATNQKEQNAANDEDNIIISTPRIYKVAEIQAANINLSPMSPINIPLSSTSTSPHSLISDNNPGNLQYRRIVNNAEDNENRSELTSIQDQDCSNMIIHEAVTSTETATAFLSEINRDVRNITTQSASLSSISNLNTSPCSSNTSTTSGGTVLAFDLSHLTLTDTHINDEHDNFQPDDESRDTYIDNHVIGRTQGRYIDTVIIEVDNKITQDANMPKKSIEGNQDQRLQHDILLNDSESSPSNVEARHLPFAMSRKESDKHELPTAQTIDGTKKENVKEEQLCNENDDQIDSFNCATLSPNSSSCNSSSSGSTVVRFDLDESCYIDPNEINQRNYAQSIGDNIINYEDTTCINDTAEDEVDNQVQDAVTTVQSIASESSEEAEWTENEEKEEDQSLSFEVKEPTYNIVILSSDESIDEESNYEIDEESDDTAASKLDEESYHSESWWFKSGEKEELEDESDEENSHVIDDSVQVESRNYASPLQTIQSTHTRKQRAKPAFKFKDERERLTKANFDHINQIVFENKLTSVDVTWSKRLTSTAGLCRLRRRRGATVENLASIELSEKLIDDVGRLQSTLAHEMCHAAAWLIDDNHKPPHGKVFKKYANLAMRRISGLIVSTTHAYITNTYKFAWACTNKNCDFVIQRHSRSVDINRHCCGKCRCRLIEIVPPKPGSKSRSFTPKQKRPPTGFSLFVQQNSKDIRAKLEAARDYSAKVSQKEVMQECGRLWRDKKTNE